MQMGRYKNHAIGVFDSGLGGLTVVKELMRQLPSEDIIYSSKSRKSFSAIKLNTKGSRREDSFV